jgi:hypothetical protein
MIETRDAFIAPKPYNSWILNEDTCIWEAPSCYARSDNKEQLNKRYTWNEENQNWTLQTI